MAKFRIEDITPPEKRRRVAALAKGGANDVASIHPEPPTRPYSEKTIDDDFIDRSANSEPEEKTPLKTEELLRAAFPAEKKHQKLTHPKSAAGAAAPRTPTRIVVHGPSRSNPHFRDRVPDDEEIEEKDSPTDIMSNEEEVALDDAQDSNVGESELMNDIASLNNADRPHYAYEKDDRGGRYEDGVKKKTGRIIAGIGIVLIIAAGLMHTVFARATVTVTPKVEKVLLDNQFSAEKAPEDGALAFSVMKVEVDDSIEIPATGTKEVSSKASGKIIIYNDYSAKTQRLIKNTRFQSPTGKIYRITTSVDVPGQKTSGGKTTPGSIEVVVYADEAGEAFNTPPTDFTIPGFSGDPRHAKIYGRSTGAITGGASGKVKTVSDADLKKAKEDMRVSLETKLRTKARTDVAPQHVAFDGSTIIALDEPVLGDIAESESQVAVLHQKGALYAVLFDRDQLAQSIAQVAIAKDIKEKVRAEGLDALTIAIPPMKGEDLFNANTLAFTLSGGANIEFVVDLDSLRRDLTGTNLDQFNTIISAYGAIKKAEVSMRPFWKRVFPTDADNIYFSVEGEK